MLLSDLRLLIHGFGWIIVSVFVLCSALLTKGAKYIVVQGLPTTGCLPLALALAPENDRDDMGCVASVNKQSYNHNAVLQSKLQDLRARFPQAVIVYGFKEPFKACCGAGGSSYNFQVFSACGSPFSTSCPDPSHYINWDGVHLTEAMYKVLADSFLNGSFSHPPFQSLLTRNKHAAPGDAMVMLNIGHPPSKPEIEDLERQCNGIPLKFCHVEYGRVSFFSFNRVELPVLP